MTNPVCMITLIRKLKITVKMQLCMKDKSRENNNLSFTTLHLQVPSVLKMSQYLHSSYFCCANKSKAQEKMVSNKLNYKASTLLHLLLRILIKGLLAAPFF